MTDDQNKGRFRKVVVGGTPSELGANLFVQICAGAFQVAHENMNQDEVEEVFAGFIGAAFAGTERYCGKELASAMFAGAAIPPFSAGTGTLQ